MNAEHSSPSVCRFGHSGFISTTPSVTRRAAETCGRWNTTSSSPLLQAALRGLVTGVGTDVFRHLEVVTLAEQFSCVKPEPVIGVGAPARFMLHEHSLPAEAPPVTEIAANVFPTIFTLTAVAAIASDTLPDETTLPHISK